MISDNHNAYNNYNNYIDEYELTNGYAVVDRNFSIVTANEPMYLEVDNIEQFKATHTDDECHRITYVIEDTILKAIDDRGVLGRLNDFKYIIAIKNINKEVKLRAFLEHIRTQISWHCKFIDSSYNIEFSIGIGRYPDNGKDLDLIKKKIQKAINMARSKGGNRYIIYKEFLHGEIEDSDK